MGRERQGKEKGKRGMEGREWRWSHHWAAAISSDYERPVFNLTCTVLSKSKDKSTDYPSLLAPSNETEKKKRETSFLLIGNSSRLFF